MTTITLPRATVEQALEALQSNKANWPEKTNAITALRAALAQQAEPLPKHDQHCVDVPGYGLMAVRLVRAVERAHGIGEEK